MRRNFLRGLIICLIPTLIAAVYVGLAFSKEARGEVGFRRGIDLAGGTILVYEVDTERMAEKQRQAGRQATALEEGAMRLLAEKLKRRIDPADQKNVIVRPVGTTRVEIVLPFAGAPGGGKESANEEFVQEVRNLVKQTGVLEFRILANQQDDASGVEAAIALVNSKDPAAVAQLKEAAEKGFAPPPPKAESGSYTVKAETDEMPVQYVWVELGKEEREGLHLNGRYETDTTPLSVDDPTPRNALFKRLELSRGTATFQYGGPSSPVIYSRPFAKRVPTKDDEGKTVEYFYLSRISAPSDAGADPVDNLKVVGDVRLSANVSSDRDGSTVVAFQFHGLGERLFQAMTERNKPSGPDKSAFRRHLAVIMDDRVVSAPTLNAVLPGSGIISGHFTQESAGQLVQIMRSGNLNAEMKSDPVSENTVGATLGKTTVERGLWAVGLSFAAVLAFMVVYYRFSGVVACVALFANLLLTVGFMVAMNAAFTLPGLAGIVLMLGMAVDANVLIYERLREEREKGATLQAAIRNGYDRALPTIIDTHLTSIFTAVVLYMFGNDALKGFSVSLTVGLLISLFTSLYITRLLFDFWVAKRWLTDLKMMRLFARPNFDFMKIRNAMFALTVVSSLLGLALFVYRIDNILNVDFTQGTAYGGRLKAGKERSLSEMLELLSEKRQGERLKVARVDFVGRTADPAGGEAAEKSRTGEKRFVIAYADGTEERLSLANDPEGATDAAKLENLKARASHLPDVSVEQVYLKDDTGLPSGKSRSFTVRTTEKENDLVMTVLDRLFREDGTNESLLDSPVHKPYAATGPVVDVAFSRPASPGYLRNLIFHQMVDQAAIDRPGTRLANDADAVAVTGVPTQAAKPGEPTPDEQAAIAEEERSNRYATLRVDVSKNPDFAALANPAATKEAKDAAAKDLGDVLGRAVSTFEARPMPDRLETFDPALAKDTRTKALWAIVASWIAILAYLWFRFGSWQFGLAAVLCLVHDLCFTLGAIAVCHYLHDTAVGQWLGLQDFKIDLTAVAALLTLVGYSVNDTIVVFDRIREVRGKSPTLTPKMINDSVNGTLSRTVLAALTVFLVVVVLYAFGGGGVHLFAFVMVMGVIVGTYSSIYIASPLLLIFGEGHRKSGTGLPVTTGDPSGSAVPASIG